eukprot:jgi/Bigna1/131660/aug1.15_g6368
MEGAMGSCTTKEASKKTDLKKEVEDTKQNSGGNNDLPPLTPVPSEVVARYKKDPECTFLEEVRNCKTIRKAHEGPTPTSNWVVPGRLLASDNPYYYKNEKQGNQNVKSLIKVGVRTFVCLHKLNINKRSNYMGKARKLLPEDEKQALEFVSFPIGDMTTRTDNELDELTDRIAYSILTRPKNVHFVHCTGGHGRTGTVVAVVLGKLYTQLESDHAMMRIQLYHDSRKEYQEYGQTCHSPETSRQCKQIQSVLKMFHDRDCKILSKKPLKD